MSDVTEKQIFNDPRW